MVYEALDDLAQAEEQLTLVVALDEAIGHPNLASDRAALERVRAKRVDHEGAKEFKRLMSEGWVRGGVP